MSELKLSLSIQEINTILKSLSQLPYAEVYGLVGKIQAQAQGQLQTNAGITEHIDEDDRIERIEAALNND